MRSAWTVVACVVALSATARAQDQQGTVRVEVKTGPEAVAGALVLTTDAKTLTDVGGVATLRAASGKLDITVQKDGFIPVTTTVEVLAGQTRVVLIDLARRPDVDEEVTVVASTRTGRRIEDQPMRVEVLTRDEIEEKMLMTPGDIVMMLNEMGGLRVQATSPSLGAASVRIQGMRGRYTAFLSDGLPLYGEQPGGLGLLQIPPMDLGQVEVIKGVASALYGAGAMGGVVNLLSRRPGAEAERELLFNRSTRGATDGVMWLSSPMADRWGLTLVASGHWQERTDVDADGWADLPGYQRGVVRPRVFWDNGAGRSFFATTGVTWEDRTGGTQPGAVLPATGAPYREALKTRRVDAGVVTHTLLAGRYLVAARAALSRQTHRHEFGDRVERDRHLSAFGEVTLRASAGRHTWVAGLALEHDRYRPIDLPGFAYTFTTPGIFAQDDVQLGRLMVSASGRLDHHSEYGWFFSPRVSALARAKGWAGRVSAGTGFFGPTPLTEETEASGLAGLVIPEKLRAERGRSLSIDVSRAAGPAAVTATLFTARVRHPLRVDREAFALGNAAAPTTTSGVELVATVRRAPVSITATYTFVRARETTDAVTSDVALTPRHSAGLVAMAESEEAGRIGLEVYLTGRQRLEVNPYRTVSEPYVIVGLLAERRFGRLRLFINGENLTNVRQGKWDPVLRSTRGADGRWTVDAWAPLEGRVINGGMRVRF